jgi:hypothetical protein
VRGALAVIAALCPYGVLPAGGVAACSLYRPGERIGALGYRIVALMLVAAFIPALTLLILGASESGDGDDEDAAEGETQAPRLRITRSIAPESPRAGA